MNSTILINFVGYCNDQVLAHVKTSLAGRSHGLLRLRFFDTPQQMCTGAFAPWQSDLWQHQWSYTLLINITKSSSMFN